jgi:hypothetical protein
MAIVDCYAVRQERSGGAEHWSVISALAVEFGPPTRWCHPSWEELVTAGQLVAWRWRNAAAAWL